MKLFPFEFKKMVFSKRFLVLLLIIVASIVALFIRNTAFQPLIEEEELKLIDSQLVTADMLLRGHQYKLEEDPDNKEEKELEGMMLSNLDILKKIKSAVTANNWQERLTQENAFLKGVAIYNEAGGKFPLDTSEIVRQFTLNKKLLDDQIKPESNTYSIAFPNFMMQVLNFFFQLGAIIVMFIVIGELMTAEFENHSAKFLFTQPLKRGHIVTSKLWTAICSYFLIVGIIFLSVLTVGKGFGKKGAFDYPILMEKNGQLTFLTISEYITYGLIGTSAMILMMVSLYLFYSLYFKQTISTLFVLLITLLGGYAITSLISWRFFAWLNPFQYVFPKQTILFQNGTDWYQGIPLIVLVGLLLYGLTVQKIKSIGVN